MHMIFLVRELLCTVVDGTEKGCRFCILRRIHRLPFTEKWIKESRSLALKVPGSVDEDAFSYILNCRHPNYYQVKIVKSRPHEIDMRLRKGSFPTE